MDVFDLQAKLSLDDSEYTKGLKSAEGQASSFGSGISRLDGSFTKMGNTVKSVMRTVAGVAGIGAGIAAIGSFVKATINAGMQFDSAMSQVAATMGTTTDQIQNLREYAEEMGRTTAFSATQAAEALNYMALAGYDAETSMSMLPNVLNLAASGSMDLAAASDMVTDASSALGLSIDQTTNMVDQMAAAASSSNTSVSQLGEAMLTIGATAKSLTGGTVELSTALGVLADNGLKGAEGGTKLRNVLLGIQSSKFEKTFGELGVSAYDADGNLRPLQDTLLDLDKAMEGWTTEERSKALTKAFNKQDLSAINALLGTSAERWEELGEEIENSAGAAEKMAETQLDNLAGDVTMFKSALEGLQIALSDDATPALRDFVQFGTEGLSKLTEAIKNDGLTGAMDELGNIVANGADMIVQKIPDFMDAGFRLMSSLTKGMYKVFTEGFPKFADAATKVIENIAKGLTQNMSKIVGGMSKVISTIVKTIVKNAPKILKAVGQVIKSVITELGKTKGIEGAILKIGALFGALKIGSPIIGSFKNFFGVAQNGFTNLGSLLSNFNTKTMALQNGIGNIFGKLTTGASTFGNALQMNMVSGQNAVQAFGTTFKQMFGGSGGLTDKINQFSSGLSVVSKGLLSIGGGAVEIMGVSDAMDKLLDGTENVGGAIAELGGSVAASAASFTMAFGVPAGLVATAITGIVGLIGGLIKYIDGIDAKVAGNAIYDALYNPGGMSIEDLASTYTKEFNEISKGAEYMTEKLEEIGNVNDEIDKTSSSLTSLFDAIDAGAYGFGDKLPEITTQFETLKSNIETSMKGVYDVITKNVAGAWADLLKAQDKDVPEMIAQLAGLEAGAEEKLTKLGNKFEKLTEKYNSTTDEVEKAKLGDKIEKVVNQVAEIDAADLEKPVDAMKKAGEAFDISQYYDPEKNELSIEALKGGLSGMAEAGEEAVTKTNENFESLGSKMENYVNRLKALGMDVDEFDWSSLDIANKISTDETRQEIANNYQEISNTMQDYLLKQIPSVLQSAGEEYESLDWKEKIWTNKYETMAAALQSYIDDVITPATETLESEFGAGIGAAGQKMNLYAQEAGQEAYDSLFDVDYSTGYASFKALGDGVDEELAKIIEKYDAAGSDNIKAYDNSTQKGIRNSTAKNSVTTWLQGITGLPENAVNQFVEGGESIGEGMSEGTSSGIASSTAESDITTWLQGITGLPKEILEINSPSHVFQRAGESVVEGFDLGIQNGIASSSSKDVGTWMSKIITQAAQAVQQLTPQFVQIGNEIIHGLQDGIISTSGNLSETITKPVSQSVNQLSGMVGEFGSVGHNMSDGLARGIEAGRSSVVNAMIRTARDALNAAKQALDIHSPSRVFKEEVGKNIALGVAKGIEENKKYAEAKAEEMGDAILQKAQKRLDNNKVYHEWDIKAEVAYWDEIRKHIKKGTQARVDADKKYFEAREQMQEESDAKIEAKNDRHLEKMITNVTKLVKNVKKAAKEIAKAAAKAGEDMISAAEQWLNNYQVFHEISLKDEMEYWKRVREEAKKTYGKNSQEYIDASANYFASRDAWKEARKTAREEAQKLTEEYAKEYKEIEDSRDKKVLELHLEMIDKIEDVNKKLAEDLDEVDQDLADKIKSRNEKLASDIQSLTDAYVNSVESRTQAIMGMTGLFDRVSYDRTYSKEYLMDALNEQVGALEEWDSQLDALQSKLGRDNPLFEALQEMGVSSLYTLQEVNDMSDEELQKYSELYAKKNRIANERAKQENEKLLAETNAQIETLRQQAANDIAEYATQAAAQKAILIQTAEDDRATIREEASKNIAELLTDAQQQLDALTEQYKTDLNELAETVKDEGGDVGEQMCNGIAQGIRRSQAIISMAAQAAAMEALAAAKSALAIHSPSKKFMWVGQMVDEGFAKGIADNANLVREEVGKIIDIPSQASVQTVSSGYAKQATMNEQGGFVQNLTVNSPTALNPSEIARQTRLANQQMVLALRGV